MKKKVVFLPYDFDTGLGITNEGTLEFGYNLEDIDHSASGADIFNGQQSVLWQNVRSAFFDEIKAMYQTLRSQGKLSYELVEQMFEAHQAKWPEAVFNEDAWYKYLQPLVESGDASYLSMLLGSKAEQRKWWLWNRFRYMDSKYNAGDALTQVITLRGYAKADITVTPYADIYATIKYASYLVQIRAARNQSYTLECPLDNVNDTEIYIYSADQLANVGDLSGLKVGYANFSMATKLQSLKLGDASESYSNGNLKELYLGNNVLLRSIDVRNCPALAQAVDLSGCSSIEYVYFDGTSITGLQLPNGGNLKVLHVPDTMTNLTIRNQTNITEFSIPTGTNITTLRLENVSSVVNSASILSNLAAGSRLRLIGFSWDVASYEAAAALYDKLDTMRGLDENGGNLDRAQVMGAIHVNALTGAQLASLQERYPDITVTYDHITSYLYYYNFEGDTLLYTESIQDGGDGTYSGTPPHASTPANTYTFIGWALSPNQTTANANAMKAVTADRKIYAAYKLTGQTYRVRFYNGTSLLQTYDTVAYGASVTYTGTEPVHPSDPENYKFTGWSPAPTNITGNTDCYAQFSYTGFEESIAESWDDLCAAVSNGTFAYEPGATKIVSFGSYGTGLAELVKLDGDEAADGSGTVKTTWILKYLLPTSYRFNPSVETIYKYPEIPSWTASGNTWTSQNRYNTSTAKATWTITATSDGTLTIGYKTSNSNASRNKFTTITVNGTAIATNFTGTTNATHEVEVSSGDTVTVYAEYDLVGTYNYYGTIVFSSTGTFTTESDVQTAPNRALDHYTEGTGAVGGYVKTELYTTVQAMFAQMPEVLQQNIKSVKKYTRNIDSSGATVNNVVSNEKLWIPSYREMFGGSSNESQGVVYTSYFTDNASRIKYKPGDSSAAWWWLRSAYNNNNFYSVSYAGGGTSNYCGASTSGGVALGFCI